MADFRIQNLLKKTWRFLAGVWTKEFWVFLFFLFLSATFWLLQALDETHEGEVVVPVVLTDVPEDVVITSSFPTQVTVKVSDRGTAFIHYWRNGTDTLSLSFSNLENEASNGHIRLLNTEVQQLLQDCLLSTSKIVSCHPDTLEMYYNHGLHKTVPVKVVAKVTASPQHYVCEVTAVPGQVTVYASPAVLDTLTAVYTRPFTMKDLMGDTTCVVNLKTIKGAKFSSSKVKVKAGVDVFMETTDTISVVTSNFPANKRLRTFPSSVMVTYTVGFRQNKKLTKEDLVIMLTYEQILSYQREGKTHIPLKLKAVPKGVTNVRIEPSEIDYLVETIDGDE